MPHLPSFSFSNLLRLVMPLLGVVVSLVALTACWKPDSGPVPNIPPEVLPPATRQGFITMNITGTTTNGTALNEFISLEQFYGNDDVDIQVDSLTRPAARIVTLFRTDTVTGSRIQLRFRVFNWRDTTAAPGGRSSSVQYYFPNRDSATVSFTGAVANTPLSDLQMRVVRLEFTPQDTLMLGRLRGEYAMAPTSNGASGAQVTGAFDVSLSNKGIVMW